MKINSMKFGLFGLTSSLLLSSCISVEGISRSYNIGSEITRTDKAGDTEKWTPGEGWKSTKQPEAAIERQPVWYISKQDSGVKAWLYGFDSSRNYRYVDPLSPIVESSGFSANGWITYLVRGNKEHDYVVRRVNFVSHNKAETVGTLEPFRNEWRFTNSRTSETFAAESYHLTSRGILLFRSNTVVTYQPSDNGKTGVLPEGWSFAWVQKGDAQESRILITKAKDEDTLFDLFRYKIGFYDIDKNKIISSINMSIPSDPKNPREGERFSNCFYLFNTKRGPISIAIEDSQKHVTVRNLATGENRIAFERKLGIAFLEAVQTNTGRIAAKAAVGFSDEYIYDIEDFLYNGNRIPPKT